MKIQQIVSYYKTIGTLEKIGWIIFGLSFLISSYVYATTNRLYREDVREFLIPVYRLLLIIQVIGILTVLVNDYKQNRILGGLKYFGLSVAFMAGIIELFDFAPCLFDHSSSLTNHSHPHTLTYTLKQSFLCPSFSHPSRLMLIFLMGLGLGASAIIYVIEKFTKPVANNG